MSDKNEKTKPYKISFKEGIWYRGLEPHPCSNCGSSEIAWEVMGISDGNPVAECDRGGYDFVKIASDILDLELQKKKSSS